MIIKCVHNFVPRLHNCKMGDLLMWFVVGPEFGSQQRIMVVMGTRALHRLKCSSSAWRVMFNTNITIEVGFE